MSTNTTLNNANEKDNTVADASHFFLLTTPELEERFDTSAASGVKPTEVEPRQTRDGLNQLTGGGGGVSVIAILSGQLFSMSPSHTIRFEGRG